MKEDYELPVDNRYEFGEVGFYTWSDAQSLCQEKGEGWDLAIIDDYKGKILVTKLRFQWQYFLKRTVRHQILILKLIIQCH